MSPVERLAVNRLRAQHPLDGPAIDRFLGRFGSPVVEGERATFLYRGDVDEVWVRHRVVGLPDPLPLKRIGESDLWAVTTVLPRPIWTRRTPARTAVAQASSFGSMPSRA